MMEREDSGIDLIHERLLASGRGVPTVTEDLDSVHVVVPRRVMELREINLIAVADRDHRLTQRERIALALVAQSESLSASELADRLELDGPTALRPWIGRLLDLGLAEQAGRARATRYFVQPALLRDTGLDRRTTLTRVQPHRLRALILEDLERFPDSASDIHRRVGAEIPERTFRCALSELVTEEQVVSTGKTRWRRYRIGQSHAPSQKDGR